MRLGVSGWRLCGQLTGVGRYLQNVLAHCDVSACQPFERVTVYTPRPIDRRALGLPAHVNDEVLGPDWRMLLWENLRLGPSIRDEVLFCPSFSRPLVTRARTVVATHDMVYRTRPDLFPASSRYYSRLYEWSDRHATLIVTDAEAVKDEIVHYCRVPAEKVRVTYLAPASFFRALEQSPDEASAVRRRWLGADVPFFLFVGKTTGRRSLPMALEAFARLRQRSGHEHRFLLVGAGTDSAELQRVCRTLGIESAVCRAGYLPDEALNALYNSAVALVSAAVYETSSLPVMEAQAAGLPVICFRNPGMSEITGGAAEMYDQAEPDRIADAMERVAGDPTYRAELSRRGLASARRFSWERCARETMAVLAEAATR